MKLYSIHFNRPDLIKYQFKFANRFGYELIIVNNGNNKNINDECEKYKIQTIVTENNTSNSISHGNCINQLIKKINFNQDWGIIDHDLFLIKKIDFENYDILSVKCDNVPNFPYPWVGMLLCKSGVDLSNINFSPGFGINGDTGCNLYTIVNKFKIKWFELYVKNSNIYNIENKKFQKFQSQKLITKVKHKNENFAIHLSNSSNWHGDNKEEYKKKIIERILNYEK